jgi:16S rRNA (adenine1518-N6/adenine1519-N6)-dimethyltransferase
LDCNLDTLPPLREVIAAHDLRAHKALGQNFLLDQNVTDKIARSAGDLTGRTVFEIGPGPGGLTRSLLRSGAARVVAIEFDERAVRALSDLQDCAQGRLQIIHGDALQVRLTEMADVPRAIVANLPYNIATPLLIGWLKDIRTDRTSYDSMTLMFQKEVGDRLTAKPGTKAYGRLSVLAQWLCDVRSVYELPPSAFTPPPKVKSSVVRFVPKVLTDDAPGLDKVEAVTALAFGQRRKMIRSSLKAYMPKIEALGIDPEKRAENLTVEEFLALAR